MKFTKRFVQKSSLMMAMGLLLSMLVPIIASASTSTFIWYAKNTHRLHGYVYAPDAQKVTVRSTSGTSVTNITYANNGGYIRTNTGLYDDQNQSYQSYYLDTILDSDPTSVEVSDGTSYETLPPDVRDSTYTAYANAYNPNGIRLAVYRMPAEEHISTVTAGTYFAPNASLVTFTPQADASSAIWLQFPHTATASTSMNYDQLTLSDFQLKDVTSSQTAVIDAVYDYQNFAPITSSDQLWFQLDSPLVKGHSYTLSMSPTSSGDEIRSSGAGKSNGFVMIGSIGSFTYSGHLYIYFNRDNVHFFDQASLVQPSTGQTGDNTGQTTPSTPPNSSTPDPGSDTPPAPPTPPTAPAQPAPPVASTVKDSGNGVSIDLEAKIEKIGDIEQSSVAVSLDALNQAVALLKGNPDHPVIQIDAKDTTSLAKVTLPAGGLGSLSEQNGNAILSIKFKDASYNLPASAIDVTGITKELGASADQVSISISKETLSTFTNPAQKAGMQLIGNPIDFKVTADANGKQVEIHNFNQYVSRQIVTSQGLNSSLFTAMYLDPASNEWKFVPATFRTENGQTTVTIKRMGNSIYTVASLNHSFNDLDQQAWAQSDINLLAAKGIVDGVSDTQFGPTEGVTRAQFVAMLVRSLGLSLSPSLSAQVQDVQATDWFAGYVDAAMKANLVNGYADGSFHPNATITREEMAVIYQRAAQFAGVSLPPASGSAASTFSDDSQISAWAQGAVSQTKAAGIFTGDESGAFNPQQHADRAQTVVALKRFLQKAGFID